MGHLEERSPGHWRVRVYVGKKADGSDDYRSRTFRSTPGKRREAQIKALPIVDELVSLRADAGTINALLRDRAENPDRSLNTGHREQSIRTRIAQDFGSWRAEEVALEDLVRWVRALRAEGKSPNTVQRYFAVLRWCLRRAEAHGWIRQSPDRRMIDRPRGEHTEAEIPPKYAVEALAAAAFELDQEFGMAVRIATHTGARAAEILALRWSDINGASIHVRRAIQSGGGQARLGPTKGRKNRRVSIDAGTAELLRQHLERAAELCDRAGVRLGKDGFIVADRGADPQGKTWRRPGWLGLKWSRMAERVGHPDVTFHHLRHWHASELLNARVPMTVVSQRLGHANEAITARVYAHVVAGADEAAATIMGELMP